MKALTLYRPWSYAIAHLGKNVENRTWKCPLPYSTQIAIHSGQKWDKSGFLFIQNCIQKSCPPEDQHPAGQIIAVATFVGNVKDSDSDWFFGPYGWLLDGVFALPVPVSCKGAQGLWTVPAPELTQILRQLQKV